MFVVLLALVGWFRRRTRNNAASPVSDPAVAKAARRDQSERQGPARGVRRGRPFLRLMIASTQREARARDRRRERLQRDLDRHGTARDRRPPRDHRIRPRAREGARRERQARRPVGHRAGRDAATRSSRSRSSPARSTSCSSTPGRRTTSASSTWCIRGSTRAGSSSRTTS